MLASAARVEAHAFGARYDLPLPLWLYLTGAGLAVALSFLVMALFLRAPGREPHGEHDAAEQPARSLWLGCLRWLCVALLLLVVIAAFVGENSPTRNFATVFVWVVWWVGLVFVQALIVDAWTPLNPWRTLAKALRCDAARFTYSRAWGHWPALVFFLLFAWVELVSDFGERPRLLGALIVTYTIVTLSAAWLFGIQRWFSYADPFSAVFGIFGRFAIVAPCVERRVGLRWPGQGLLSSQPVSISMTALVVCLLATVSFDGFVETPAWLAVLDIITESESLRAPLLALQGAGIDLLKLLKTVALMSTAALFFLVFLIFAWLIDRCAGARDGLAACAGLYVLTLVPIALGYHIAHYLSYLLIAGQLIIPLASDPFAMGWDLFATADYRIDIAIVDARFVWYTAISTIVVGHVMAVYLAHATALRRYVDRGRAIRSQLPMLVLMVAYTMTSLWILSQPIVEV